MSRDLLIAVSPGELWAAVVQDDDLVTLRLVRTGTRARVGDVVFGRIVALRPDLPAALVDIGLDRPAFLSVEDAPPGAGIVAFHEGQAVIVQITKDARADKAAGVSMRLRLSGRLLDFVPARPGVAVGKGLALEEHERLLAALRLIARPGEGFVVRAAAAGASSGDLVADADALRARRRAIEAAAGGAHPPVRLEASSRPLAGLLTELVAIPPDEIVIDDRAAFAEARGWLARHHPTLSDRLTYHRETAPLFEHRGIAGEVALALAPRVPLLSGGALVIEITAAATVIDVDSGRTESARTAAEAILATNLAAAREVARQIRLRNLAGAIVVDFVGMKNRGARDRVRDALAAALADDGDADVLGWTRLGHLELVRKRRHAPLAELLFERAPGGGLVKTPTSVALDALRSLAREAAASPARLPVLHVHPEVAAVLAGDAGEARQELEGLLGRTLTVVAEPGRARETFDIRLG